MFVPPESVYAHWRRVCAADSLTLQDSPRTVIPERLLQLIWAHQRLNRDALRTADGRSVTVLHPGFWNREAGPDFQKALIQFDREPARSGDIEIDLESNGWIHHRHHANPRYSRVLLHVVWKASNTGAPSHIPTLVMDGTLDSPLEELRQWLIEAPSSPPLIAGQCTAPLQDLPEEAIGRLLHQAAEIRFQLKAHEILARARAAGWEQALWEGLFTCLGYKANPWPMRRLAELRSRWMPDRGDSIQSDERLILRRLLGIAGLIPINPSRLPAHSAGYVQELWQDWWRERASFDDVLLQPECWRWNGIRPANHPQRRLVLASHWLADPHFIERIEAWLDAPRPAQQLSASLLELLLPPADEFWARHWTFRSRASDQPKPLLGADRVTDIAMNALLPWAWMRARLGHNERYQSAILSRYFEFPGSGMNAVLKLAQDRLFGGTSSCFARKAALQQGVLQIVRDFCNTSDAVCSRCRFPELVRSIGRD